MADVLLITSDGAELSATRTEAEAMHAVAMFIDGCEEGELLHVPVPAAAAEHVMSVLRWLRGERTQILEAVRTMPAATLFPFMNAVDYLDVPDLLDELCRVLADRIRSRSIEEIAVELGIDDDELTADSARRAEAAAQHALAFGGA